MRILKLPPISLSSLSAIIALLSLFIGFIASAQTTAKKNTASPPKSSAPQPIILKRADVLKNRTVGEESVKELIGNVAITRGDMEIECQHAFHYQKAEKIIFTNDVHYSDSLRDLWADKVIYYIPNDSLEAIGAVKIAQRKFLAFCQRAHYSEERKNVFLKKDVKLVDNENSVTLTGYDGFGDDSLKYARVLGRKAVLVQNDSLGRPLTTIYSLKIEYFDTEDKAVASDSVEIYREDLFGECSLLTYFLDRKKALMEIQPSLTRGLDVLKGDTIHLFLAEEKLDRIEIYGNASVVSPVEEGAPAQANRMFGKNMIINVEDGKISRIFVSGNARSIYYIYEEAREQVKKYKGANSASGDRIYLHFLEGKLKTINVAGGTEGTYYPSDFKGDIE